MNINFKKTKLDDDALMYQKSKDSVTKEDIKNLSFKEKVQYFKDYYAKKVLVIILIIAAVCAVLNTTVFNPSTSILSVIFLNECMIEKTEELQDSLEEYIGIENKNDYISVETFNTDDYQMNMAYMTRLGAGSADIIICSYDDFTEQAARGAFADLSTVLPKELYDSLSARILEGQITETDMDGNVISYEDPLPFGIDLSDSPVFEDYEIYCTDPVLCISSSVANEENALKAIEYFLEQ